MYDKILKNKKLRNNLGFTIVELLIVIVIIGILAAITLVSYTGISKKANEATMQADLANASKKIKMYYALYNSYPESMPNDGTGKYCPSGPTIDTNYCIKPSTGTFTYSAPTPTVDFSLVANSGTLAYTVTKDNGPISTATTPITAVAAITGTAQIGQTLTAGALTPGGATATYQWQSATTAGGTYSNILGATSNTYAVSPNVMGKYVKLVVTGTGIYTGTQISTATAQIPADNTNWLTIGNQTWAKANLNVGTMVTGNTEQTDNGIVEKYCYDYVASNCTTYGALYQWREAMQYSTAEKSRGICPAGSHIPSDNEWKILEMQLGMTQVQADLETDRGTDQGNQLKSGGSSGLNIPLAGIRDTTGTTNFLNTYGVAWSSTPYPMVDYYFYRYFKSSTATVLRSYGNRSYGISVRCLGD